MTTGVPAYSTTPANNVNANTGVNWDEGMNPGAVNNSSRQNMADLRSFANDLIWFQYGSGTSPVVTPAYASGTSFTVAGIDVTAVYHAGRRVKAVGSGTGTIYGSISSSSFSTNTTVNVTWDSGSLTNEALTIYLSQAQVTGKPIPSGAVSGFFIPQNYLSGLVLSTAGSSATFAVAAGMAADGTNAAMITLASSISKTTSSWAVGSGNGSLDTGAIANSTWYHVWLIERTDTGVVDVLVSLSASSPTMPANYTLKRGPIGSMKTDGSAHWTKFVQLGDNFIWDVEIKDADTAPANGNAASVTLTVPTGVQVDALFSAELAYNSTIDLALITSLDVTDTAPGTLFDLAVASTGQLAFSQFNRRTNTSAQVRVRVQQTGNLSPTGTYRIFTYGWNYARGK